MVLLNRHLGAELKPQFLVVGTVRNVGKSIYRELKNLDKEFSEVGEVEYFLVESDSSDNTLQELARARKINSKIDFLSMGNLSNMEPHRIARLILVRNQYVKEIRTRSAHKSYKFIVVADFDGVNTLLQSESLTRAIKLLQSYDVICANQRRRYYDLLALRHKYWCPENVFATFEWYRTVLPHTKAKQAAIFSKMITIDSKLPPIEVESAFGGLAIYKVEVFDRFDYALDDYSEAGDIDHVVLNRKVRRAGGKIVIDPQLINGGWNSHNLGSFRILRVFRYWTKRLLRQKV